MNPQRSTDLQGVVKFFADAKGYGFIRVDAIGQDVFVHATAVQGSQKLTGGDKVTLNLVSGSDGRSKAANVRIVERAQPSEHKKPNYGRRLKRKDSLGPGPNSLPATLVGTFVGALFGPVGSLIGGAIGALGSEREVVKGNEVKETCLRCNGTAHITSITAGRIGFQCEKCGRFWSKQNREGLKESDLEEM